MSLFDLSGRVAIVTGGNGGIGLGMAEGLAAAGASVVVAARNPEKSEAAVARLTALGAPGVFIPLDAADPQSCREMVRLTVERFGRLDILVNNAGMSIRKPPQDYAVAEWQAVIDTNLTGAFVCCQAAYPPMKARGGGKIINIGSMMSIFGGAYAAPYSTSKGGLVQLTKSLGTAWAKDNIQVNAVLPGWIDTELTRDARAQVPGPQRAGIEPHPGRPLGPPCGSGGDRRLSRRAGLRFRDRRRDPGRWRLRGGVLEQIPTRLNRRVIRRIWGCAILRPSMLGG